METIQRDQLIKENIKLAYWWGHKWKGRAPWIDQAELMSCALIGILKAAETFNEEKGKFSTYMSKVIENEVLIYIRNTKNDIQTTSLEDIIFNSNEYWGDEAITGYDLIKDPRNSIDEWITNEDLKRRINVLNEDEKLLIYLHYIEDLKQADIAKVVGHSQPHVNRKIKIALEKMRKAI